LPFNCGSLMLALTFARKPGLAAVSVAALEIWAGVGGGTVVVVRGRWGTVTTVTLIVPWLARWL
jgi:hypothetical protein